ncbi:uncharacterized protein LOC110021414 [Phalaenopsis equestris]|uniref:uncharacterized protein LOC110021414 n=1 Tax=Phalaenopsis equestris TaxID=78828 RepID=UPI0009E319A0|nr:uncharacterized protein LOC110021414 [Phalaenopsis equestris]
MGYPALITTLCVESGVKYETWEKVLPSHKPIRKFNKPIGKTNLEMYGKHVGRRVDYDIACHEAMEKFLRGDYSVVFPTFPRYTAYKPDDVEEDVDFNDDDDDDEDDGDNGDDDV